MFGKFTREVLRINTPSTTSNLIFKRFAGHSKWANIKHTKALKDAEKGKLFTKLGRQMKVAIQEGGSADPSKNLRLEQVVAQARRMNMPVASIQNVIKSTQKDKTELKTVLLEIRGPGGSIILCEVCTANITKLKNEMASILRKHYCKYSEGSQNFFDKKGVIETELPVANSTDAAMESATNHAIECDAEDVKLVDETGNLQFFCDPWNFTTVEKNLENLNYKVVSATMEYIPKLRVSLSDSDLELCGDFFDKLEGLEEVIKLYDNIA